jgi:ubiquinone/menaquinone biosynthesis C-methylase UbiE
MNKFFNDNHKLVFQEWIDPSELKGATVLDLGSQTGWLGEYCIEHGASEYVGVEIDEYHVKDAQVHYPNLTFFHMDLEDYVDLCVKEYKTFDIVVISRTIHGIQNQMSLLQDLSKISKKIIIESGVPLNQPFFKLLEIVKNISLSSEQTQQIKYLQHYVEYQQTFVEYVIDDRWPQPVPSIGILKDVLFRLGFDLDLITYESVKEKYPTEYGYDAGVGTDQVMKRCILKFVKTDRAPTPISWKEWENIEGK